MADLAETAMSAGGWDPRYARVMEVTTLGDHAAALVDTNGDGADINVDLYCRDDDGTWVVASGNGSLSTDEVMAHWDDEDQLTLTYVGGDEV